ncbi:MAG TPA: response regulator transcription factor [Terriglobia bacterium]|nr:response regulator transcription factor [Terriglobia bacterium]
MSARRERPKPQRVDVCVIPPESLGSRYLRHLLRNDSGVRIVLEENLRADHSVSAKPRTIVILNLADLELSPSRYVRTLRTRVPICGILAVTKPIPVDEQCGLLFLGIDGIISRNEVDNELGSAIRSVAQYKPWATPQVLAEFVQYSNSMQPCESAKLTSREAMTLQLLNRGYCRKEIANILNISESTVKFHLSNLYAKLKVDNRYAAIEYARSAQGHRIMPGGRSPLPHLPSL